MIQSDVRSCGSRGLTLTRLGLGGAALGRGPASREADEAGAQTLEAAYRLGIRHVDTSPAYGESERRLGIALRRNTFLDLTVSTKVGTHPNRKFSYIADDIRWSLENSLRTLGRSYVDIALIHDPPSLEPAIISGDGFEALHRLREEGLCRNVGLGVHSHEFHYRAIDAGVVDIILPYGDFNIVRRTGTRLMRYAQDHGVGVLLGSPMMHGLLAADEEPAKVLERRPNLLNWYTERDIAVAQEWYGWCRDREVSMRHLNMQFVLGSGLADCVLTGALDATEIDTNVHEAVTPVPQEIWSAAIARIADLDAASGEATPEDGDFA